MTKAMEAYVEFLEKRKTGLDRLLPQDPRDESEKCAAEELAAKVSIWEILEILQPARACKAVFNVRRPLPPIQLTGGG